MQIQNNNSHHWPLSVTYDILSLKNFTLLTADLTPCCMKSLSLCGDSHSHCQIKLFNHLLADYHPQPIWPLVLPLDVTYTLLICFTLFLNLPVETPTFHVPNLISIFCCLCCSWWRVVSSSLNSQAGGPSLVGHPQLLIQHICGYPPPPFWRLYPLSTTQGCTMPWTHRQT
jgi:hypothetical protein